jgi:hypothetical protein
MKRRVIFVMKKVVASVLLFAGMSAWAQQAPFCAVTASGSRCNFYTLSACQQAVQGMDGACAANVAQQPQFQTQPAQPAQFYDSARAIQQPDFVGSFQRGVQQGQQQRLNQQAIEANQQQQQDAAVGAERLKLIARALIQAKPAERPELLAQMASIDPQMALQYQQMLTQMDAQRAASAPNNSQ